MIEYLKGMIKVLCIDPYDGLIEIMEKVAGNYPNLDVICRKGDLVEGLKMAENASSEGFDIIVSRGGTYELIKRSVEIPVVNIELSGYDFIRALKLIKSYTGKSAVVGFPFLAEGANSVNEIMETGLEIIQIKSEDEVEPLLKDLRNRGYNLIIGDAVTDRIARRLGMNGMLLTSGEESVAKAYEDVVNICSITGKYKQENILLEEVLNGNPNSLFLMDKGSVVFTNLDAELMEAMHDAAVASLAGAVEHDEAEIITEDERYRCSLLRKTIRASGDGAVSAFYVKGISRPDRKRVRGLTFRNPGAKFESVPSLFRNRAVVGCFVHFVNIKERITA
ncbi:MAG: PrpR N-terminal domain-containing protein [Youngiibacter sp.]|nr:PrpR N-terminal domain-containing protein [Youngiibacter sp.]